MASSTSTPNFDILPATWRDLIALRRLEEVCFGPDAWPLVDLLAALTAPGMVRLKAGVNGDGNSGDVLAGFVGGDARARDGTGWITTIGVLPAYRRLGLASLLLDRCERSMGQPRVRLCVRASNDGAIQLYQKRGYHKVSVWARYYSGGEDALVLERVL